MKEFLNCEISLSKNTSYHRPRQIKSIVPWDSNSETGFTRVSELHMGTSLMMDIKTSPGKGL